MNSTSSHIRSIGRSYVECARGATRGLIQNPAIIAGSLAAFFLFSLLTSFLGPLGFAGGMLLGLAQIALISLYYSWLSDTLERDKLSFTKLWSLDYGMFFTVLSVAFVLWILRYIIESLTAGLDVDWIIPLMRLAVCLIFNAIPEVIYIHRIESLPALLTAAKFTERHWIEWYLPLLLIISPWLILEPLSVLLTMAGSEPLLPPTAVVIGASSLAAGSSFVVQIAAILLGVVLANWYMLFRAQLFKALDSGAYRRASLRP